MSETWPRSSVNFNTPNDRSPEDTRDYFLSVLLPFSDLYPLGCIEVCEPTNPKIKGSPENPFS